MAYVVPQMPLVCGIWDVNLIPQPAGPDRTSKCNLAWGRRVAVPSTGGTGALGVVLMTMTLLLPAGTNIWGDPDLVACSVVEVPLSSGRYYRVAMVDDIGKGFANEHRAAVLVQGLPWPHPIP